MREQNGHEPPDVVVAVDWSGPALRAVRWAAAEASRRAAPLRLVHAAPYARDSILGKRRATWLLALAEKVAHNEQPQVPTRTEWVGAHLATTLREASGAAQLLVLGMAGGRWFADKLTHSVAFDVCAAASCPVVVVPARQAQPPADGPVVIGVEDVDREASALTAAFDTAHGNGSSLVVLHVVHGSGCSPDDAPEHDAPAQEAITRVLAPWGCRYPDVPVDVRVVHGSPSPQLREAAAAARLIVVGTHTRDRSGRPVLDRTGRALARHCACPVMIVRSRSAPDHRDRALQEGASSCAR